MANTTRKIRALVGINNDRAKWALEAVAAFQRATGLSDADGLDTAIGDLLGDLQHLCDQKGLDFEALVDKGGRYYEEETFACCDKCKRTFDLEAGDGENTSSEKYLCKECA